MALSVMNYGRIRDLVSNLGWRESDGTYTLSEECSDVLENIEEELLNEDVVNRNVHISLHILGTVKKDLIPILLYAKNNQILSVATRVLVHLSLPVECLSPVEDALLTSKNQNIRRQLLAASFEIKKAFLNEAATSPIVTMLREGMIKSEKHNVTLTEDDCIHIKNCLVLLRNILHIPEESDLCGKFCSFQNWQFVRNKLIWNLFVQGLDAALLLMLNSKYKAHWTIPLTLIIALLYRNQNVSKVHEALETISSASDTSCDEEESDGSKNSSTSLSSEPSKTNNGFSDSGCALISDTSANSNSEVNKCVKDSSSAEQDIYSFDIHTKLEKVQISDDSDCQQSNVRSSYDKRNHFSKAFIYGEIDSESSSCSESPHHKKIKVNTSQDERASKCEAEYYSCKEDSGINESMDHSSPDIESKSSDDNLDKKSKKNFMAVQKLRSLQIHAKVVESDSSNEDMQNIKIKYRSHPPSGRRGKSPRRINGCIPLVCLDSAIAASESKGRIKYPLWEKRNSVTTLVDFNSSAPTDEDIGNLIKEFTMSFLHAGFNPLIEDMKNLLHGGLAVTIDKSLFFWLLSYFLHLAATVHLNVEHMSKILKIDVVSYLVYECVLACENMELHSQANSKIKKYLSDQLCLVVTALKEIFVTVDLYSRKSSSLKDKSFFSELCGKLTELQHVRYIPLLLFQICHEVNSKCFTEDIVILNHYIITNLERGVESFLESKKINFAAHLKHFCTKNIMNCYGQVLQNYKYNSDILNGFVFTMMHHIAGDVHSSDLLIEPLILKSFSSILKEDIDLEPYQEDLIMYILNKFSLEIQKNHLKKSKEEEGESSGSRYLNSSFLV